MAAGPGAIRRAWYQWKMKDFPWRKKRLIGFDLHGNTFWEFKDALHSLRNRRIAKYSRSTHLGDVQVSPSWMQWLRHTRFDPPTLAEQQNDRMRQQRIKLLAAQADAKWSSKPSALDAPDKQQPAPMLQSRDPTRSATETSFRHAPPEKLFRQSAAPSPSTPKDETPTLTTKKVMKKEPKDSPWKQAAGNPGENWQPQGWTPALVKRKI